MSDAYLTQIARGAEKLNITLTELQLQQLGEYLQLMIKWNKAYNLTAIREPEQMIKLHLLDSLAVYPHLKDAANIIDVGTGGGLPGVVLAIMCPEKPITLLDSNGKKTRFLVQVKAALKLAQLTVINSRVEQYQPEKLYAVVTSRAFASLADMVHWCKHLLAGGGNFMAMKGQYPEEEVAAIADEYKVEECYPLQVPGVDAERHLLAIKPLANAQ